MDNASVGQWELQHGATGPLQGAEREQAGWSSIWPALIVLVLLYGSWLPFDFKLGAIRQALDLRSLAWIWPSAEDLIINLLAYLPLGLAVATCRQRWGRISRSTVARGSDLEWFRQRGTALVVARAAILSLSVSLFAELGQNLLADRVPSGCDVMLNMLGGMAGAVIGLWAAGLPSRLAMTLLVQWRQRPLSFLAVALPMMWVLLCCSSSDWIRTEAEFKGRLLAVGGAWDRDGLLSGLKWDSATLCSIAAMGLLGFLITLNRKRKELVSPSPKEWAESNPWPMPEGWVAAARHAVAEAMLLAALVETLQLFQRSGSAELAPVLMAGAAAAAGAVAARHFYGVVSRQGSRPWERVERRAVSGSLAAFAAVVVVYWAGDVAAAAPFHIGRLSWPVSARLPFMELWRSPMLLAAGQALALGMVGGLPTVALLRVLRRTGVRLGFHVIPTAVFLLTLVVAAWEAARAGSAWDPTAPLMAFLMSWALARAVARLQDVPDQVLAAGICG